MLGLVFSVTGIVIGWRRLRFSLSVRAIGPGRSGRNA
jgi:hypothetical protein